jgi:hypothetical protein
MLCKELSGLGLRKMLQTFSGGLSLISALQLSGCCQKAQSALVFDYKGIPATANKLLLRKGREQPRHGFTRNSKDFGEFLMRQWNSEAGFTDRIVIFPQFPLDEDAGKSFC